MITMLDIEKIGNIDLCTYSEHRQVKGYPEYIYEDLIYPASSHVYYDDIERIGLKSTIDNTPIDELFIISKFMEYGDYDNSCMVERSNRKLFLEEHGLLDYVFEITGGYGSAGVLIALKGLLNLDNEESARAIIDCLNSLNDYPCIDDEDMSNMEYEAFYEALKDYGVSDTCSALSKKYRITVHDYNEEKLKELILDIDGKGNPVFMIEAGGSCYIGIDDMIVPKITKEQFLSVLTDYEPVEE